MNWYYAQNDQRIGPITEDDLLRLVQEGTVTPATLVWREGMAQWQPYEEVASAASGGPTGPAAAPPAPGLVCSECGKTFPPDEVIQYGGAWVCAGCKPIFVQKLKEGAPLPGVLNFASFWIRFGAKILDGLILWVVNMLIGMVAGVVTGATLGGGRSPTTALALQAVMVFFSLAFNIGYGTFFLGRYGATPGKMACKIKVVMADGGPVTYGRGAGRCLAEILSGLLCYVGYIMAGFDEERRTLHDRLCNTRVVKL